MQFTTVLLLALGVACAGAVKWTAKNTDDETCAIFAAETITAKLNIATPDNTTEPISFSINNVTQVIGKCDDKYNEEVANSLEISFFPNGEVPAHATEGQPWRLFIWFLALSDPELTTFKLVDWRLETSPGGPFNSTTQNFTKLATSDLEVHASGTNGFNCSTTALPLSEDSSIELKDAKVIANAILGTDDFPAEQIFEQCEKDKPKPDPKPEPKPERTPVIVPIVTGICLLGLIAVVLIVYLIGRSRNARQGYASV